ncbi:MAG: hypothetical protein MUO26_00440 [Methanotrichaceae archaeon]|nr:hypothetical protein [Methanotrichaceae archaeon]
MEGGHPCPNCGAIKKITAITNDFKEITGLDGDPFFSGSGFDLGGAWIESGKGAYLSYANDRSKILVEYS